MKYNLGCLPLSRPYLQNSRSQLDCLRLSRRYPQSLPLLSPIRLQVTLDHHRLSRYNLQYNKLYRQHELGPAYHYIIHPPLQYTPTSYHHYPQPLHTHIPCTSTPHLYTLTSSHTSSSTVTTATITATADDRAIESIIRTVFE